MTDRVVWPAAAAVIGAVAALGVSQWVGALVAGRPVIYGEGAVAHAAILFRDGAAYRDASGVVAANYPPLYLALSSLGDPLRTGRAISVASALAVAAVLAWRGRDGGVLRAGVLALSWLALAPVMIWGAAVKPDVLAVALTLGGVVLLERARPRDALVGGALLGLAVWAKPTALLPALAVLAWAFIATRSTFVRAATGGAVVAAVAVAHAALLGAGDVWRHVVAWNALAWSAEQVALLIVVALGTLALLLAVAAMTGAMHGIALAYVTGAVGVVLLGGREGATINYILDLAAATLFALARAMPRLSGLAPIGIAVQVVLIFVALAPFGLFPGREGTTGAWGRADRADVVATLGPGLHLVEDSGLLIATKQEPAVDDLFLWSRLVRAGLVDPELVLGLVRRGELASIVSEADLARLDAAPAYERARWDPRLVRAVLDRYALERSSNGLWVYRPR